MASMRIGEALPHILQKGYPVLDPKTKMLPAMSLLRFHEIDVLPLSFDGRRKRQRGLFGSSCLARIMLLGPRHFRAFLDQPCEIASDELVSVRANQSLSGLLNAFSRTRLGFASVQEGDDFSALISLADVLGLYETGIVASDLTIEEIGSPIFSMPGETTLRNVLEEMFQKWHRRVFVRGKREFISDRGIMAYIFSPAVLNPLMQEREAMTNVLDAPISSVERMVAKEVAPDTTLKVAASALKSERAGQCLVFDGMVVTPWDLVMKPWKAKALKLKNG